MWPEQRAYLHTKWHPNPSNRLATILQRHRQTDRTDKEPIANKDVLSQSPNLHICITSSLFNLLAPVALHLFFILSLGRRHLFTYNWSFLPVCLTLYLESTPYFSPSTPFQSLCRCLACSCSYHIFSLCRLTTFIIRNSLYNSCYYALPVMQSVAWFVAFVNDSWDLS